MASNRFGVSTSLTVGTAAEADVCSSATSSYSVSAGQKLSARSASAEAQEEIHGSSSCLMGARSLRAVIFDRDWIERIKRGRQHGGVHADNKTRETDLEGRVWSSRRAPSIINSVVESPRGFRHLAAAAALGVEIDGNCAGDTKENSSVRDEGVLAFPRWSEDRNSSSLAQAWRKMAEGVLRQGRGGDTSSSASFTRPWYPSQWNAFQAWTTYSYTDCMGGLGPGSGRRTLCSQRSTQFPEECALKRKLAVTCKISDHILASIHRLNMLPPVPECSGVWPVQLPINSENNGVVQPDDPKASSHSRETGYLKSGRPLRNSRLAS